MKPPKIVLWAVSLAFNAIWLLAGCGHVPPGGATEIKVKFGVPGVFNVTKNMTNLRVSDQKIALGDTDTTVQVALFEWVSSAKGVVIANPAERKP